jgi:hypothetical protein
MTTFLVVVLVVLWVRRYSAFEAIGAEERLAGSFMFPIARRPHDEATDLFAPTFGLFCARNDLPPQSNGNEL